MRGSLGAGKALGGPAPGDAASRRMDERVMTISEVALRTGLSQRSIRKLETQGLVCAVGRSPGNYRLFDESALWCVQMVRDLRSLGLTLKEIRELAAVYLERPDASFGPQFASVLERARGRVQDQLSHLRTTHRRIEAFRREHGSILTGQIEIQVPVESAHRSRPPT